MRITKKSLSLALLFPALGALVLATMACASRPDDLGIRDDRLAPCPTSPNCVCSFDEDEEHRISPIAFSTDAETARNRLVSAIEQQPRAEIIESTERYVYAEFTSALFRFVDDVEFLIDEGSKVIHVRSASRSGYSDLGANRRRVETIRDSLSADGGF